MGEWDELPGDVRDLAFDAASEICAENLNSTFFVRDIVARAILAERERCAKVARRFVGYADSDAGSAHPRAAKELAESTASWIEQEIMEPTAHG